MINYQDNPKFSFKRSQQRLEKAKRILGQTILNKILAFALYLLGANIQELAAFLKEPADTVKSLTDRIFTEGLSALEDRRGKKLSFIPQSVKKPGKPVLSVSEDNMTVLFNEQWKIQIPRKNKFQCRVVLLSMLEAGLFEKKPVAEALQLSMERTRKLRTALFRNDIHEVIDRRHGQQRDYRMTPESKAELIQQYVLNLTGKASTSSVKLSDDLRQRCELNLAPRTIRFHIDRMGLKNLKTTLPLLIYTEKKTSNS